MAQSSSSESADSLHNLMVRHIPNTLKVEEFKEMFEQVGPLARWHLPKGTEPNTNAGFGFVKYESLAHAAKAIKEFNGKQFQGKTLHVFYSKAPGLVPQTPMAASEEAVPTETSVSDACKLMVRHIPQGYSEDEFKTLFSEIGAVSVCRLMTDKKTGTHLSYGFVEYCDIEDAAKAIETLNGKVINGNSLHVFYANAPGLVPDMNAANHNLMVRYIPSSMTVDEFRELFSKIGEILTCRIATNQGSEANAGYGFVLYKEAQHAAKAIIEMNGYYIKGKRLSVFYASTPHSKTGASSSGTQSQLGQHAQNEISQVMVRYIPSDLAYNELKELFATVGPVLHCYIKKDQDTGKNVGYGFVQYKNPADAVIAVSKYDGYEIKGKRLRVFLNYAGKGQAELTVPQASTLSSSLENYFYHSNVGTPGSNYQFGYSGRYSDYYPSTYSAYASGASGRSSNKPQSSSFDHGNHDSYYKGSLLSLSGKSALSDLLNPIAHSVLSSARGGSVDYLENRAACEALSSLSYLGKRKLSSPDSLYSTQKRMECSPPPTQKRALSPILKSDSSVRGTLESSPQQNGEKSLVQVDEVIAALRKNSINKILVILRGPPGSGKSTVAEKLKKRIETSTDVNPEILSIDSFFMVEIEKSKLDPTTGDRIKTKIEEYMCDPENENSYKFLLTKQVKRLIGEGKKFLIMDAVNETVNSFAALVGFAGLNGYEVYIGEILSSYDRCVIQNIHQRSLKDIEEIFSSWQDTPYYMDKIDLSGVEWERF